MKRPDSSWRISSGTPKALARREAIYDVAARHLNRDGIAGTDLREIAAELRITRPALYYYVKDRDDLAFQSYQRACLHMSDNLAMAREQGGDPAARIRFFIDADLAFDQPTMAVVSELSYFAEDRRRLLQHQIDHNRRNLRTLIERGIAEGQFRACHSGIAADLLIGMLNWSRISTDWLDLPDNAETRHVAKNAVIETFLHGIGTTPCPPPLGPITLANIIPRSNGPATGEERISARASTMFNMRGVEGTSLDDIALSLKMTKGAIYHYFASKSDLVIHCYRRSYDMLLAIIDHASQLPITGCAKAAAVFSLITQAFLGSESPMRSQPGYAPSGMVWENAAEAFNKPVINAFLLVLSEGIQDRSIRPLRPLAIGSAATGAIEALAQWRSDYDTASIPSLADEVSMLLTRGLEKRPAPDS